MLTALHSSQEPFLPSLEREGSKKKKSVELRLKFPNYIM